MVQPPESSDLLEVAFVAFAVLLALGILLNVHLAGRGLHELPAQTWKWTAAAAVGLSLWLSLTWMIAATGVIGDFNRRPPPMLLMVLAVLTVSIVIAFTAYGTRFVLGLPLWILVAGQSFRLPLELLMHRAFEEGVMPAQMSYSGWNFDILTGLSAIPVAWLLARGYRCARTAAVAWNLLGVLLLINILTIAVISTPLVAAFGADRLNTWVAHPPFVWLPTVMVVSAITGHLVIFRKLRATATPPHARRWNPHERP